MRYDFGFCLLAFILFACGSDTSAPDDDSSGSDQPSSDQPKANDPTGPSPPVEDDDPRADGGPTACVTTARTFATADEDVVQARFASATRLVYSSQRHVDDVIVTTLYEQDLCSDAAPTKLAVLEKPQFALAEDGAPIVYLVGDGGYRLARVQNGELEAVTSECLFDGSEPFDVASGVAVMTSRGQVVQVDRIELETPGCVKSALNVQDAAFPLGAGQSYAAARLSRDGARVAMAGSPLGTGPQCEGVDEGLEYDDNDFLLYDVATEQRSMVDFTPSVPAPECETPKAFAWYSDHRRVVVSGLVKSVLDTETGATSALTVASAIDASTLFLDVAPDDGALVVVTALGAYVAPL